MRKLFLFLPLATLFCLVSNGVSQSGSVYLSPTSLRFGDCWVGEPPCKNAVTLYDTTSSSITISREAFEGGDGEFSISTNACGTKLDANSHCDFVLEFTPPYTGEFTATFYVYDSATGSPQTASLTAVAYCKPPGCQ